MLNFLHKRQDYLDEKTKLKLVFDDNIDFVKNPFLPNFSMFTAFEFDKLYTRPFFQGIMNFLYRVKNETLTFYTLSPSPLEYFFENFLKYSIVKMSSTTSYADYIEFLARDPGNSPADALIYNAERICLYSDYPLWGLTGSKDLEIGIVGFKNIEIRNIFLSSFAKETFTNVKDRTLEIEELLGLDDESKTIYSQIEKSYETI